MNIRNAIALAAVSVAAMSVGSMAPAAADPPPGESAEDTINNLLNEGYRVIVSKVGTAPLDQCSVNAIRPGQEVTEPVTGPVTGSRPRGQEVVYTTIYVDAQC